MQAAEGLLEPAGSPAPAPSDAQRSRGGAAADPRHKRAGSQRAYELVPPGFFGILAWTSRMAVNIRLRSWPP